MHRSKLDSKSIILQIWAIVIVKYESPGLGWIIMMPRLIILTWVVFFSVNGHESVSPDSFGRWVRESLRFLPWVRESGLTFCYPHESESGLIFTPWVHESIVKWAVSPWVRAPLGGPNIRTSLGNAFESLFYGKPKSKHFDLFPFGTKNNMRLRFANTIFKTGTDSLEGCITKKHRASTTCERWNEASSGHQCIALQWSK